jgi:K+-sensing histidine kinase KdpD
MSAPFDGVLIEQVLINSPERYGTRPWRADRDLGVRNGLRRHDRGRRPRSGILAGQEEKILEQFYRSEEQIGRGVGLGSISSAILRARRAHLGREPARRRAAFRPELPREGAAPRVGEAGRLPEYGAENTSRRIMSALMPVVLVIEDEPQMRRFCAPR